MEMRDIKVGCVLQPVALLAAEVVHVLVLCSRFLAGVLACPAPHAAYCSHHRHPAPQARHTGIKITQQIAILMGCAVLPHLKSMVDIIKHGLVDENQKVGGAGT